MKGCKNCGKSFEGIWLSDDGLCSLCYYNEHKQKEEDACDYFEPSLQATCFICLDPIFKKRLRYVHFLWNDELYEGNPICDGCYFMLFDELKDHIYLDYSDKFEHDRNKGWKNCSKCGLRMPMTKTQTICDICKNAKPKGLDTWL